MTDKLTVGTSKLTTDAYFTGKLHQKFKLTISYLIDLFNIMSKENLLASYFILHMDIFIPESFKNKLS